jgi:hypothetical protein
MNTTLYKDNNNLKFKRLRMADAKEQEKFWRIEQRVKDLRSMGMPDGTISRMLCKKIINHEEI